MADNAGEATWSAVVKSGSEHGYGTSSDDVKAYAEAGGGAAAAAACAAYGAGAAAPLCATVGAAVAGAIAGVAIKLWGSNTPVHLDDDENPVLDGIMHKLSEAFPSVPWIQVKTTFAKQVMLAAQARRKVWLAGQGSLVQFPNFTPAAFADAARYVDGHYWLYMSGPNVGYIDEGMQAWWWNGGNPRNPAGIDLVAAMRQDLVVGATNAATELAGLSRNGVGGGKAKPASPLGWILGGLAVVIAGVAAWKYSENKKKKLAA